MLERRNRQKALAEFKRAIEQNPNDSFSFHKLGLLYLEEYGDAENAEILFRRAIELKPHNSAAYCSLAALYKKKDPAQAEEYLSESLKHDPNNSRALKNLGLLYTFQNKEYQRAFRILDLAKTKDRGNASVCVCIGQLYEEMKKKSRAKQEYVLATTQDPMFPLAFYRLGKMEENAAEAAKQFERAVRLCPIEWTFLLALTKKWHEMQNWEGVLKCARTAVKWNNHRRNEKWFKEISVLAQEAETKLKEQMATAPVPSKRRNNNNNSNSNNSSNSTGTSAASPTNGNPLSVPLQAPHSGAGGASRTGMADQRLSSVSLDDDEEDDQNIADEYFDFETIVEPPAVVPTTTTEVGNMVGGRTPSCSSGSKNTGNGSNNFTNGAAAASSSPCSSSCPNQNNNNNNNNNNNDNKSNVIVCPIKHVMVRVYGRPIVFEPSATWSCEECGKSITQETLEEVGAWHCVLCKYELCGTCTGCPRAAHVLPEPNICIAHGGFGEVWREYNKSTGQYEAVKHIPFNKLKPELVHREYKLQRAFRDCPFIVQVNEFVKDDVRQECQVHMELMKTSLQTEIRRCGPIHERECRKLVFQALLALSKLHTHNPKSILHRDIKPDNLLLDANNILKLSDFGLSKHSETSAVQQTKTWKGTILYMSPEILLEEPKWTYAGDIWALGCTWLAMAYGSHPWVGIVRDASSLAWLSMVRILNDHTPIIPQFLSEGARNVLAKFLIKDYRLRPTADMLLMDPYFAELMKEHEEGRSSSSTSKNATTCEISCSRNNNINNNNNTNNRNNNNNANSGPNEGGDCCGETDDSETCHTSPTVSPTQCSNSGGSINDFASAAEGGAECTTTVTTASSFSSTTAVLARGDVRRHQLRQQDSTASMHSPTTPSGMESDLIFEARRQAVLTEREICERRGGRNHSGTLGGDDGDDGAEYGLSAAYSTTPMTAESGQFPVAHGSEDLKPVIRKNGVRAEDREGGNQDGATDSSSHGSSTHKRYRYRNGGPMSRTSSGGGGGGGSGNDNDNDYDYDDDDGEPGEEDEDTNSNYSYQNDKVSKQTSQVQQQRHEESQQHRQGGGHTSITSEEDGMMVQSNRGAGGGSHQGSFGGPSSGNSTAMNSGMSSNHARDDDNDDDAADNDDERHHLDQGDDDDQNRHDKAAAAPSTSSSSVRPVVQMARPSFSSSSSANPSNNLLSLEPSSDTSSSNNNINNNVINSMMTGMGSGTMQSFDRRQTSTSTNDSTVFVPNGTTTNLPHSGFLPNANPAHVTPDGSNTSPTASSSSPSQSPLNLVVVPPTPDKFVVPAPRDCRTKQHFHGRNENRPRGGARNLNRQIFGSALTGTCSTVSTADDGSTSNVPDSNLIQQHQHQHQHQHHHDNRVHQAQKYQDIQRSEENDQGLSSLSGDEEVSKMVTTMLMMSKPSISSLTTDSNVSSSNAGNGGDDDTSSFSSSSASSKTYSKKDGKVLVRKGKAPPFPLAHGLLSDKPVAASSTPCNNNNNGSNSSSNHNNTHSNKQRQLQQQRQSSGQSEDSNDDEEEIDDDDEGNEIDNNSSASSSVANPKDRESNDKTPYSHIDSIGNPLNTSYPPQEIDTNGAPIKSSKKDKRVRFVPNAENIVHDHPADSIDEYSRAAERRRASFSHSAEPTASSLKREITPDSALFGGMLASPSMNNQSSNSNFGVAALNNNSNSTATTAAATGAAAASSSSSSSSTTLSEGRTSAFFLQVQQQQQQHVGFTPFQLAKNAQFPKTVYRRAELMRVKAQVVGSSRLVHVAREIAATNQDLVQWEWLNVSTPSTFNTPINASDLVPAQPGQFFSAAPPLAPCGGSQKQQQQQQAITTLPATPATAIVVNHNSNDKIGSTASLPSDKISSSKKTTYSAHDLKQMQEGVSMKADLVVKVARNIDSKIPGIVNEDLLHHVDSINGSPVPPPPLHVSCPNGIFSSSDTRQHDQQQQQDRNNMNQNATNSSTMSASGLTLPPSRTTMDDSTPPPRIPLAEQLQQEANATITTVGNSNRQGVDDQDEQHLGAMKNYSPASENNINNYNNNNNTNNNNNDTSNSGSCNANKFGSQQSLGSSNVGSPLTPLPPTPQMQPTRAPPLQQQQEVETTKDKVFPSLSSSGTRAVTSALPSSLAAAAAAASASTRDLPRHHHLHPQLPQTLSTPPSINHHHDHQQQQQNDQEMKVLPTISLQQHLAGQQQVPAVVASHHHQQLLQAAADAINENVKNVLDHGSQEQPHQQSVVYPQQAGSGATAVINVPLPVQQPQQQEMLCAWVTRLPVEIKIVILVGLIAMLMILAKVLYF